MTPGEKKSFVEDQLNFQNQLLGPDGDTHLSPFEKKKEV